jgi:hypothetical protein
MLVKDLIEQLSYMDKEAEVHFAYGYGDHWRTTVAPKVSQVFRGQVQYSDYHRMDRLVVDEDVDCYDEDEDYNENARRVVIIE